MILPKNLPFFLSKEIRILDLQSDFNKMAKRETPASIPAKKISDPWTKMAPEKPWSPHKKLE